MEKSKNKKQKNSIRLMVVFQVLVLMLVSLFLTLGFVYLSIKSNQEIGTQKINSNQNVVVDITETMIDKYEEIIDEVEDKQEINNEEQTISVNWNGDLGALVSEENYVKSYLLGQVALGEYNGLSLYLSVEGTMGALILTTML